jgi:pilus assembly protein Flp/PilA
MSFETIGSITVRDVRRFLVDDSGATAIEYALIASGIGAAVAATVWQLGTNVKAFFTTLAGLLPG